MTMKTAAAFMTYVHSDDKYGQLSTLCERLSDEVQIQTGNEFPIFQDRTDIKWGQNWRERIENSLDEVTFLIPIITPGFFKSKECRKELQRFLEREKKLGRNDLIFPVYFVDTPLLNDFELRATDELAEIIATHQYADWRELRFELFTNPQVGKALARLGVQIRDALQRLQPIIKAPAKTPAAVSSSPTATVASEQSKESPITKKEPPTCLVDPYYRGDFVSISEAVKNVAPGTRILVRPGLYTETVVIAQPLEIIGDGEPGDVVVQVADANVIRFQTAMGRISNLTIRQIGGEYYGVDIVQGRLELEDCDITSKARPCIGIHGGADPRLRRNRIHDCKDAGIYVYDNAQGTLEDNEIFNHSRSGVAIDRGGAPTLRRNRIYNNKENGVYIYESGQGVLEDNAIFGNGYSGVSSRKENNPVVRNNRINLNRYYGISVQQNGHGIFENNDLTNNKEGAWAISEDSKANVTRVNNKEN